jgi:hypothetical protein
VLTSSALYTDIALPVLGKRCRPPATCFSLERHTVRDLLNPMRKEAERPPVGKQMENELVNFHPVFYRYVEWRGL